jgi:hypothetical protein
MPPVSTTPEPEKGSPKSPFFGRMWGHVRCAPHNGTGARRRVPVIDVKQNVGDLKLFTDLMMMVPDKLIYSAVDALMYPSYVLGAHGSIAAIRSALEGLGALGETHFQAAE